MLRHAPNSSTVSSLKSLNSSDSVDTTTQKRICTVRFDKNAAPNSTFASSPTSGNRMKTDASHTVSWNVYEKEVDTCSDDRVSNLDLLGVGATSVSSRYCDHSMLTRS